VFNISVINTLALPQVTGSLPNILLMEFKEFDNLGGFLTPASGVSMLI